MGKIKLVPPCSYQGGKQRLAKKIVDVIYEKCDINPSTKFYDLCCGSGAVSLELINRGFNPNNIIMVDNGVYGEFWHNVSNNEISVEVFAEMVADVPDKPLCKQYLQDMSKTVDKDKYIYQYLLLQSGSFGWKEISLVNGEWKHHGFRDYWQPTATSVRRSPCNPMQPNQSEMLKRVINIKDTIGGRIKAMDCKVEDFIENVVFDSNSIVYIDPPYMNTTGYSNDLVITEVINQIPSNVPVFVSECNVLSDNYEFITSGKSKGNITGVVKTKRKDDILNIFNV